MKKVYIVAYDVKNERRLARVHNYLKGHGVPLQKSVFYCLLTKEGLKRLQDGLSQRISAREDDVRIYPLLSNFESIALGQGDKIPNGVWVYLD